MYKGLLFDLDGVIVDTAKYHYISWKELADGLGIPFTEADNERLKGVSRMKSFEIILEIGNREMGEEEKKKYCDKKNEIYLNYIKKIQENEILPGVREFLEVARKNGYKVALGSASKNAGLILDRLNIKECFDEIVDGTKVSNAKPHPEVFERGAQVLGLMPEECIVFEDSVAGIRAAHAGGMKTVGIGTKEMLPEADYHIRGFVGISMEEIEEVFLYR